MEPENTPLEKENHLPNQTIIFSFYVNLRGCIGGIHALFLLDTTSNLTNHGSRRSERPVFPQSVTKRASDNVAPCQKAERPSKPRENG